MLSFVLTHFDQKLGPRVLLSVPEKSLDPEMMKRIENFMDLDFGDSSFEINLSDTDYRTFNNVINLPSRSSRGFIESFLLSIIADKRYNSDVMFNFLKDVNEKFSKYIKILEGDSVSQSKFKEILEDCQVTLGGLLSGYQTDQTLLEDIPQEENLTQFLSKNIKKLIQHIAGKNEFHIKDFELKEKGTKEYLIQIELKGQGFLTGPLKKITLNSVREGVKKYMISNGILKDHFEIKIK